MDKLFPLRIVSFVIATMAGMCLAVGSSALETRDAERLAFVLQHVGPDYALAVRDGRVVSPPEYAEVLALITAARARLSEAPSATHGAKIASGLEELEAGIRERASAEHMNALIDELVDTVSREIGGLPSPGGTPDLVHGRSLYVRDCSPCHGTRGAGDGWAQPGMIPSPTSFRDPGTMSSLSARDVAAAIRFGIDGTAMPSHDEAYASGEAWDVASFVMTMKDDEDGGEPPPIDGSDLNAARRLERTFTQVAERILPSVVGISLFRRQTDPPPKGPAADRPPGWQQDGLDDLYPGYRRIRSRSGVLASEDGYVLTCGHLFDPSDAPPADTILDVETSSGQHFRAWIVGIEPTVDLAVLKVEAPIGIAPVTFGDSDTMRTGRFAIAVGDPPGPALTFAFGTISAHAKAECYQDDRTSTLLQWSSRIGAESLGGPLVDLDGKVVGITVPSSSPIQPGGRDEGPAYALPIKLVRTLFDALKVKHNTRSPWLGFAVRPLTWDQRRAMHAPQFGGIEIVNVFDPSPASRGGIRMGDLLMEMDGNRINAVYDFQYWLYLSGIDKQVTLKLFRDGAFLERRVTIEHRPANAIPR